MSLTWDDEVLLFIQAMIDHGKTYHQGKGAIRYEIGRMYEESDKTAKEVGEMLGVTKEAIYKNRDFYLDRKGREVNND